MNVGLELDLQFLLGQGILLGPEDLRYGLERGFVKPGTVIDVATHEVSHGADDPVLQEVAYLLDDEQGRLPEVLDALDDPERIHDPRESVRKWLFLELHAAYLIREQLSDPLGFVEQIYAEFDYPPSMARFVRFMPLEVGDEPGEDPLMRRWAEFLNREQLALQARK